MRLVASYPTRAALMTDVEQQLGKRGLLVRGAVPAGLQMYENLELEVACEGGSVVVPASVIQMFPGLGVAVAMEPEACAQIEIFAVGGAAASEPEPAPEPLPVPPKLGTQPGTQPGTRPGALSTPEIIQQALHGDRDARMAVLRNRNRTLHVHVLRNPQLTLDEVTQIAKMTTVSVEVLRTIAERREWGHRPEIAIALARNPTFPPQLAAALVGHVSEVALRQLAKDPHAPEAIQRAARRKLLT